MESVKRWVRGSSFYQFLGPYLSGARARLFDFTHNVDTGGIVRLEKLAIASPNAPLGLKYEGIDPSVFHGIFRSIRLPENRFVFVDFGSGKGRALLLAGHYPFRKVIGVEFSPELHGVAQENLRRARCRTRKCDSIESVLADAAEYQIPEEPGVFFFHNPFEAPILARVLANIAASVKRIPREALIVYVYPQRCPGLDGLVEQTGLFQRAAAAPWWTIFGHGRRALALVKAAA